MNITHPQLSLNQLIEFYQTFTDSAWHNAIMHLLLYFWSYHYFRLLYNAWITLIYKKVPILYPEILQTHLLAHLVQRASVKFCNYLKLVVRRPSPSAYI